MKFNANKDIDFFLFTFVSGVKGLLQLYRLRACVVLTSLGVISVLFIYDAVSKDVELDGKIVGCIASVSVSSMNVKAYFSSL